MESLSERPAAFLALTFSELDSSFLHGLPISIPSDILSNDFFQLENEGLYIELIQNAFAS
jgi:hypothetical protein